jgi:uncharacterized coiled-coil protein SlyX
MGTKRLFLIILLLHLGLGGWTAFAATSSDRREVDPWERAAEESFWYSLYNVENLVLTSGAGAPLSPTALERAGLSPDELSGLFPIEAPFRAALPRFAQTLDPERPESLRWSPRDMEQTITLEALGYTVLAELGWAARLEQLLAAQSTSASIRREAQLFVLLAHASAEFAERKLRRPDGLYREELRWWRDLPLPEGPPPWRGQLAWLWALSALTTLDTQNPEGEQDTRDRADALFRLLDERLPWEELTVREASLAVKALAWFTGATRDPSMSAQASQRVAELAERLLRLNGTTLAPADRAAVISGLLYAYTLTDDARYRLEALNAWDGLRAGWDEDLGVFRPDPRGHSFELTLEEIGELLSAFHTLIAALGDEGAKRLYVPFFETLKAAGVQRAEGPEAGGGLDGDPVPAVREAGVPPVLVAAVRYDPEAGWQVSDRRFLTARALYAANVWLWLGWFRGEGFAGPPAYGLPTSPIAERAHLPRRLSDLEKRFAQMQQEFNQLNRQLAEIQSKIRDDRDRLERTQTEITAGLRDLEVKLERELSGLRREVESQLSGLRGEFSARPDEEALQARIAAQIERRIEETIGPQLEALAQNLDRFDERLRELGDERAELDRIQGQLRNLIQRVEALEEGISRWPVRPEVFLIAIFIIGIALLLVGLLGLRRRAS